MARISKIPQELKHLVRIVKTYPRAEDEDFMRSVIATEDEQKIKRYFPTIKDFWEAVLQQYKTGGDNPMAEPFLDKSLERLGYKWVKESPDEVGKAIAGMLKTRNAKCYVMDVYTRDQVYRNLSCSWAGPQGLIERILQIRFNRDTGSDFQVTLETKEISEKEKYLT